MEIAQGSEDGSLDLNGSNGSSGEKKSEQGCTWKGQPTEFASGVQVEPKASGLSHWEKMQSPLLVGSRECGGVCRGWCVAGSGGG